MGRTVVVDARIATSGALPKYPGFVMAPPVMQQIVDALNAGSMPQLFDHDAAQPISVRVIEARLVPLESGEVAVDATLEYDAEDWERAQRRFAAAGAPGGYSYTASAPLRRSTRGASQLVIAADAAAWTDDQREEARSLLDAEVPADSELLFQFTAGQDIAAVFLILARDVGIDIIGDVAVAALKRLVGYRAKEGQTRIEIRRTMPDGSEVNAVMTTDDPEAVAAAIRSLPGDQAQRVIVFDDDSWSWPR